MADEVTLQSEQERIKRLERDLADANKAQESAINAMTKRQKDASTDELLELADGVRTAKAGCDKVQATINAAQRTIARLEWEAKSAKLTAVLNPIGSMVREAVVKAKQTMGEYNVTGLVITVTDIDKANVLAAVKPTGPDVPKPPKGKGGGGGGRKSTPVTVDGQEYLSANAALKEFYPDSGPLNRASIISKLTSAGHTVS